MLRWLARAFGKARDLIQQQAADVRPAPEQHAASDPHEYLVAEISFSRENTRDDYLRLGQALVRCREKLTWITRIGGLDDLLRGKCPEHFSKAVGDGAGGFRPLHYDPILVWGQGIHPGQAIALLQVEIPSSLG